MSDAIEVEGLVKTYNEGQRGVTPVKAVDQISFTVHRGETFGFLGPNGAGKTTTINILTTLLPPSEGTACVMGHDVVTDAYGVREEIGIVPEISNIYEEYSAWDNLMFTGRLYGVPKRERERQAEELLRAFSLWEKRQVLSAGFSKGMKRRLCLAMGLMHRPHVLFLDEPTSGLDVQSVLVIREMVRRLRAEGVTIFLTTHNIEEASQSCDRVAFISYGRLAAVDSPENLRATFAGMQSVEVAFTGGDAGSAGLDALPGVREVRYNGDKWRLYTDVPGQVIPAVVDCARTCQLTIASLNTLGPSLEEVFVKMTGITPPTRPAEATEGHGQGRPGAGQRRMG
jgi:ABC-2 type transport system ATP-binding protein